MCREILCEGSRRRSRGGRVGRLRAAIHRKLAAVGGSVCVPKAGPPRFPALRGARGGQGRRQAPWGGGRRSGEACPAPTERASVLSANLPLDGNFGR